MHISYNKLWKLLIDKGHISMKQLSEMSGVSSTTLSKLKKEENVNTDVLVKICKALDCDISDICEIAK